MSAVPDLTEAARELCHQRGLDFQAPLGRGAFKSAYLALSDGAPVALKLARVEGSADRLIREAAALQGCNHHSIARLVGAFTFPHQGKFSGRWWRSSSVEERSNNVHLSMESLIQ